MKRWISLLLSSLMLLSVCACTEAFAEPAEIPMRTRYVIPEGATSGPEPDESCYGSISLDEPEKTLGIIQQARDLGLLREDETVIFDPLADFYRGADRQDIEYYLDKTILVICWKEVVAGCTCSYAEVKIADASQFRRKLADDMVNPSQRYFSTELHQQTNAVLSLNADFYQNRDLGLLVYDRQLLRFPEYTYTGSYTYTSCLENCFVNSKGEFLYTELGENFNREGMERFIADNDILFSMAFGPILIRDGQVQECSWYPVGEINQGYSRAGIGIVDELHYLYMSLNHCPEKAGSWTVNEFARHFGEKDVQTAYCLDGGQTGEMVFQGRPYNHIDFGEERRVSDNIYFATGIGAEEILEPIPDRATLSLRFAEEPLPAHESFVIEDGEWAVELLLSTDRPIRDLSFLSLSWEEAEQEFHFVTQELGSLPELTPERPLLLKLVIHGDLPGCGISYVDPDGTPRRFAIGLSGEDGSPVFWEF
ncbi:MAG: phosphodiester glycosidase family protein [Oscillospiraceae bacterium]|nr:phosphodiester glycosidase family protein [Oscillospiraceae bacterium]